MFPKKKPKLLDKTLASETLQKIGHKRKNGKNQNIRTNGRLS